MVASVKKKKKRNDFRREERGVGEGLCKGGWGGGDYGWGVK